MEGGKKIRGLINRKHGDGFDDLVTINNQMFGYSDTRLKWPEVYEIVKERNQGIGLDIKAEWFYELLGGTAGYSELNAITLYRYDVNTIQNDKGDIITAFSGISFVEMEHYDHIQELIIALGGDPNTIIYSNSELNRLKVESDGYMKALDTAIKSENDTIDEINRIGELLSSCNPSQTRTICEEVLAKQLADEKWHLMTFYNLRKMF